MFTRENLLLEDFGPFALVNTSNLENLCSIEPSIAATAHHGDVVDLELVHRYARINGLQKSLVWLNSFDAATPTV
jgi:hypothetical protein